LSSGASGGDGMANGGLGGKAAVIFGAVVPKGNGRDGAVAPA
jgi:hypothetical protein